MKYTVVIVRRGKDGKEIEEPVSFSVLSERDAKSRLQLIRGRMEAQHGKSNLISVEFVKE